MTGLAVSAFVRGHLSPTPPDDGGVDVDGSIWQGCSVIWTGADGTVWDLLADDAPVLLRALTGIGTPPVERWRQQSVTAPGSRRRGSRWLDREIGMTVEITRKSSAEWVATDEAWHAGLDPDVPGRLQITWGGRTRWVEATLAEESEPMDRDPTIRGTQLSIVTLAADPLWHGDPVRRSFGNEASRPFFAVAPNVLGISAGTISTATITNPGDEPTWPVWTVTGPCASVTVGTDAGTVVVAGAVASGDQLIIDTRPDRQTIRLANGTDRAGVVTSAVWAPVPAGADADLTIAATSTGSGFGVDVVLDTLYRRPWGTR